MASLFTFAGVCFWLIGFTACTVAKSTMHDSTAGIFLLIGTVFMVGAALLREIREFRHAIKPPVQPKGPGDIAPRTTKRWFR